MSSYMYFATHICLILGLIHVDTLFLLNILDSVVFLLIKKCDEYIFIIKLLSASPAPPIPRTLK